MAQIKYSPLINYLRGSVGNATFQNSIGGNVVRNKPALVYRATPYQVAVRAAIVKAEYAWRELTDAQRQQYVVYLSFSPDYQRKNNKTLLSAYSLFVKYNTLRILQGLSVLTDITFAPVPFYPVAENLYWNENAIALKFAEVIDRSIWDFQFRSSAGFDSRHTKRLNDIRILQHTTQSSMYHNFFAAYNTVWGVNPGIGQWVHWICTLFHTSQPFVYSPFDKITQVIKY